MRKLFTVIFLLCLFGFTSGQDKTGRGIDTSDVRFPDIQAKEKKVANHNRDIVVPDVKWPNAPAPRPKPTEHFRDLPQVPWADLPSGAAEQFQLLANRDFTGGLNLKSFKTNVPPKDAIALENALWTRQGELVKRPGYSIHSATPEVFNFIDPYYQQDEDKYVMGGSDTALYFWCEDSADWTYLIGTGGTSGRWDGATFSDKYVFVHPGITPSQWDGDTITQLGVSLDTLQRTNSYPRLEPDEKHNLCWYDTITFGYALGQTVGETNEYAGYMIGYYMGYGTDEAFTETVYRKDIVVGNTEHCIHALAGYSPSQAQLPRYSLFPDLCYTSFYSWFGEDSVWREGKITRVDSCVGAWGLQPGHSSECRESDAGDQRVSFCRLQDSTFAWDSTFAYNDYIFYVISGAGAGFYTYLGNYKASSATNGTWNDSSFFVYSASDDCFDTTTKYKIYAPKFTVAGRYVEVFDGRLWIAHDEQSKNRIIYSNVGDAGLFSPEHNMWIYGDDGDWITGMKTFYSKEGGYRATPLEQLIVSKNNSMIKVVPTEYETDAYMTTRLTYGVGCISNWTMASAEGGVMLFADQEGVYGYDGQKVEKLSLKIDPLLDHWDYENGENFSGIYNPDDRHYYISPQIDTSAFPDGGFCDLTDDPDMVVTWRNHYGGQTQNVWVQKMRLDGTPIGPNKMVEESAFFAGDADIIFLSDKTYIISYLKWDAASGEDLIIWRELSRCTTPNEELHIVDSTDLCPRLASNHNDMFVIVWEKEIANTYVGIWAQWFYTGGDSITSWVSPHNGVDADSDDYREPAISMNTEGKSIIAWTDYNDAGDGDAYGNIYASRFDSAGNMVGNPFKVNDDVYAGYNYQYSPEVSINNDGKFVIVWVDTRQVYEQIYAQRYDSVGNAVGSNFKVSSTDSVDNDVQYYPSVSMCENGQFVVCWEDERFAGIRSDIFYQRCDSTGTLIDTNRVVYDTSGFESASGGEASKVKMLDDGRFVIIWAAPEYDSVGNIWGQLFDSTGTPTGSIFKVSEYVSSFISCVYPYFDVDPNLSAGTEEPPSDTWLTYAWSYDFGGWSQESFGASAYCYQYGITDDVKILFADPNDNYIYEYGTQADDISTGVVLTYQTPYMDFGSYPNYDKYVGFGAIEGNGTGDVTLTWYKDFEDSVYANTISFSGDTRTQEQVTEAVMGKTISMKLTTNSAIDDFLLSGYWWKYRINTERR